MPTSDKEINVRMVTLKTRLDAEIFVRNLRASIEFLWPTPKKLKPAKVEPATTDIERLREKLKGGLL